MSPYALIVFPILLFALIWASRPASQPKPEISGPLTLLWWLNRFYTGSLHQLDVENEPPLPATGPAILVSNHTCGIDHLILQASTSRLLGFMVAQEFYDFWVYHPFCKAIGCIPVKRDGKDTSAVRAALKALKNGRVLPIFPEGRINPSSGREFHEPKPGAAYLALRSGVPVIPAYIRGTPPTNQIVPSLTTPSHARVRFGPPIDLSDLTTSKDHESERAALETATERLMGAIRGLKDNAPTS